MHQGQGGGRVASQSLRVLVEGLRGIPGVASRQSEFCAFQPSDLGWRDFLESSFLFWENKSGRSYQCWDGAHRGERLQPHRAEEAVSGPSAAGLGLPAARDRSVLPLGRDNPPQGPSSRGFRNEDKSPPGFSVRAPLRPMGRRRGVE